MIRVIWQEKFSESFVKVISSDATNRPVFPLKARMSKYSFLSGTSMSRETSIKQECSMHGFMYNYG
jgi:hypothetical protein